MTASAPAPQYTIRQVLAIPAFRRLWLAQFISMFGDFVALYAVYSMVSFRLHASAREVTLITVAFLFPFALIGPMAGVFVDRWDAKRTMITSDLIRAALALLLVFASSPYQIYGVLLALSTVSSFFVPAQSVTTPLIVPREALMSASAAMQQTVQVVRILSPMVAGAVVGTLGERVCYYLDSASFLFSAMMIGTVVITEARPHLNKQFGSALSDLFSGMRFILTHPVVGFVILSIAAGTFAIACFSALLPVYVRDILHGQTYLFGALGSLVGAGMLAGGAAVGTLARKVKRKEFLVSFGIILTGVFILAIAAAGERLATMAASVAIGAATALIVIPATALMQSETQAEMRGRVSSSSVSLVSLSQGVALLFAGDLASRVGIVAVYYASAVMLFVVGLLGLWRLRHTG
jgi:DHA3 family macrolide efflux protein-like MFS transporter